MSDLFTRRLAILRLGTKALAAAVAWLDNHQHSLRQGFRLLAW